MFCILACAVCASNIHGTSELSSLQVGNKALGGDLFDQVVQHLNLLEYDYFSLEHMVPNQKWELWIEAEKPILKQVR